MRAYIPTEKDLIDELCNAREIDWTKAAQEHLNYCFHWNLTEDSVYMEFMNSFIGKGRNFPEIPLNFMLSPGEWRNKSFQFISDQFQKSPEEYQGYILDAIDRYLTAAAKIMPRQPDEVWSERGNPEITKIVHTFCCPKYIERETNRVQHSKMFLEWELARKIFILKELHIQLSELANHNDSSKKGRKIKMSSEKFERDIWPTMQEEFPWNGGKEINNGIIRRCDEIGKKYGVSGSTIKRHFYDMREKTRGN